MSDYAASLMVRSCSNARAMERVTSRRAAPRRTCRGMRRETGPGRGHAPRRVPQHPRRSSLGHLVRFLGTGKTDGATGISRRVRAERPRRAASRSPARRCAAHDRRGAPRRRRARDPRMGLLASGPSPLFVRRCVRRVRSSAGRATPPSRAPRAGAATVPTRLDARPEPLTSERHCSSQARVGSKISCAARRATRTSRWP
jgi:hypothetical protein